MNNNISKHHDDSLYYECLAKVILESKFKNWHLEIVDKPDLQDDYNEIGIEVTQILPYGCNQATSLMKKKKIIDGKLKEEGYTLAMPGMLFHPVKTIPQGEPFPTYNYLLEGIKQKINKISTYGKDFNELDLYVFTDNLDIDLITLKVLLSKIIDVNRDSFDNIFVDACYKIFHLKKDYVGEYYIEKEKYTNFQYRAMKIEEDIKNE